MVSLLCAPLVAHAAGGACPSGANYINPALQGVDGPRVTLASMGVTSCFYVAANGSDSNDGLSEAAGHPLLHAPFMKNCTANCATIQAAFTAGEAVIFRGGDTYHYFSGSPQIGLPTGWPTGTGGSGTTGWNWTKTGTSANPIYVGYDPTWFTGSSWARIIISNDNPINPSPNTTLYFNSVSNPFSIQGIVSSCSVSSQGALDDVYLDGVNFVLFDGFEFSGMCWNDATSNSNEHIYLKFNGPAPGAGTDQEIYITRNYYHGYTHVPMINNGIIQANVSVSAGGTGYVTGDQVAINGGVILAVATVTASGGVVTAITMSANGGTGYSIGTKTTTKITGAGSGLTVSVSAVVQQVNGGNALQQGNSQNTHGTQVMYNVFDGSDSDDTIGSAMGVDSNAYITSYNVFNHLGGTNIFDDCHSVHDNLFQNINNSWDSTNHSDMFFCIGEQPTDNYFYNNLVRYVGFEYNTFLSTIFWFNAQPGNTDYIFNNVGHDVICGGDCNNFENPSGAVAAKIYNNTWQSNATTIWKNSIAATYAITTANNHYITPLGTGCTAVFDLTSTVNGGNASCSGDIFQTLAAANAQGYTSANDFQPTAGTNKTVGAGANEFSQVSAFGPAFANSTTNGCTYVTTNHTVNCPAVNPTVRWTSISSSGGDAGAYLFTSGGATVATPTFLPVPGTYLGAQSVAISSSTAGATITYTTDGSTPIPGSHGTVYTGPITVSVTQVVKAIGSETGFTNSAVASGSFTINPPNTVVGSPAMLMQ